MGVKGLFPLHWCSYALNDCSGGVQYSFIDVHVHSHAFRGCSILTHRHSGALTSIQGVFSSDTNEILLMVTPQWVAFNNDSMAVIRTHWVFTLTLAVMYTEWVFRGCSILTHWHSCTLTSVQGVFNTHSKAFSPFNHLKVQYTVSINLVSISIECLFFGFAKQEDLTSHLNTWLVGGLGVWQRYWQEKIRK
jgi:hypothetical protein